MHITLTQKALNLVNRLEERERAKRYAEAGRAAAARNREMLAAEQAAGIPAGERWEEVTPSMTYLRRHQWFMEDGKDFVPPHR
jgi:hypothetical protein